MYALLTLTALIVFWLQPNNPGFTGPERNHGWSGSHALAIMTHATPENRFVGHTMQIRDGGGGLYYQYFDRYAPVFSPSMNLVLRSTDDLATRVYLARQAMNVQFVATMFLAFLILRRVFGQPLVALAAVLFACSGFFLLYYKDMPHFDQPALLGNFLVLYAILRYRADGLRWPVYLAAIVAVSLGRGYSTFPLLGLWALIEVIPRLRQPGTPWQRLWRAARTDAVIVCVLSVLWVLTFLAYTTNVEADRRGVDVADTSIVESASRRLPFLDNVASENRRSVVARLPDFSVVQFDRFGKWFIPLQPEAEKGVMSPWAVALRVVMLLAVPVFIVTLRGERRVMAFLMAAYGIAWIFFMINLTHGHEFTMMFGLGWALVFYTAIFLPLARWRIAQIALVITGLGLFTASNSLVRAHHLNEATNNAVYTRDYGEILHAIGEPGRNVHPAYPHLCVIEDTNCMVLGFYLGEHYLSPYDLADYVVARHPYHVTEPFLEADDEAGLLLLNQPLTPDNTVAFVFDRAEAQPRTIPEAADTLFRYGDEITLQAWDLPGGVTVGACDRVVMETWWSADQRPAANYSLLLALQDTEGRAVADANSDLSALPTAVWVPGTFVLDARTLTVPCDTPPGSYALVLSVYQPGAPASLPVSLPDGTPSGDFTYITTLFVD